MTKDVVNGKTGRWVRSLDLYEHFNVYGLHTRYLRSDGLYEIGFEPWLMAQEHPSVAAIKSWYDVGETPPPDMTEFFIPDDRQDEIAAARAAPRRKWWQFW